MSELPNYKVGMLVEHPSRPEWGPGKVVKIGRGLLHVFWRDNDRNEAMKISLKHIEPTIAEVQDDDLLDNMPPLIEKHGVLILEKERLTLKRSIEHFHSRFPRGFQDPEYIGSVGTVKYGERAYKMRAHRGFVTSLGQERFQQLLAEDMPTLCDELKRVMRSINLLSPYEKAALADALDVPEACGQYLKALGDVLNAESIDEDLFERYTLEIYNLPAKQGRVATWPVATIFPFLHDPTRHMFLKPEPTKAAADALGFHLNYKAELNWLTYYRLLEMARIYKEKLAILKPVDLIDIQSFFWVVAKY